MRLNQAYHGNSGRANIYQTFSGAQYSSDSEWSARRYAQLFKPGSYPDVTLKVHYYTQVLGLGASAASVLVNGLYVDNLCFDGDPHSCLTLGALNNFWRGVENIHFQPKDCPIPSDPANGLNNDKCIVWNVSQAAPLRHIQVDGDLMLGLAGCFSPKGQCNPPGGKST